VKNRLGPLLLLAIAGIVVMSLITIPAAMRGKAQTDLVSDLTQRLILEGVPLKEITINSQTPFLIEIVLQSSSDGKKRTREDFWYKHLAWREAALAYKNGDRLDGFTLSLLNSKGDLIDSVQLFLSPDDPSQKPYPFGSTKLDDTVALELVKEQIDLYGLSLERVDISTGIGSDDTVQILKLKLSSPNIDVTNKVLPSFIPSLKPFLTSVNKESGVRIGLLWLEVVDNNDELLLEYLWDLEVERTTWYMAEGIRGGWFSTPLEPESEMKPTITPDGTKPAPPTAQPYPEPNESDASTQPAYPLP
jgi:hypothetical protein